MYHYRSKIREKIISMLRDGIEDYDGNTFKLNVNGRVFDERTEAIFSSEMPCCAVYTESDEIDSVNSSRDTYDRLLSINIDIIHNSRERLDDILDDLAWQTEIILLNNPTLSLDQVHYIELAGTRTYNHNTDGQQIYGVHAMTFMVKYYSFIKSIGGGTLNEFLSFGKSIDGVIEGEDDKAVSEIDQTIRSS